MTPITAGYVIVCLLWLAMVVDLGFGFPIARWLLDLDREK